MSRSANGYTCIDRYEVMVMGIDMSGIWVERLQRLLKNLVYFSPTHPFSFMLS